MNPLDISLIAMMMVFIHTQGTQSAADSTFTLHEEQHKPNKRRATKRYVNNYPNNDIYSKISNNEPYEMNSNSENDITSGRDMMSDQCGCRTGAAGTPGIPGVPGMHGQQGIMGYKGDTGAPGAEGPIGKPGPSGPEGPPGGRGRKGHSGLNGTKGDRGVRGYSGVPGLTGPRGHPGDGCHASNQVAFSSIRTTKIGPVLQDTPVTFDRVVTNVGEAFNTLSSHFIAPLNGTYVFMAHILSQNNKTGEAWIMHNSKHKVPLHGDGRAGHGTGSQTIIMTLAQNDHVWLQLTKDSGLVNDYSTFSGYLLFTENH